MKQEMILGPFQGSKFTVITLNPRVTRCVPRDASFPIPLTYIDVTRATSTSLDVMLEKSTDDYWNVDGDRDCQIRGQALRDSRYWMKIHPMDFHGPGATDKEANDILARLPVATDMERPVRSVETKREAKVGCRKTEASQCKKIVRYLLH